MNPLALGRSTTFQWKYPREIDAGLLVSPIDGMLKREKERVRSIVTLSTPMCTQKNYLDVGNLENKSLTNLSRPNQM